MYVYIDYVYCLQSMCLHSNHMCTVSNACVCLVTILMSSVLHSLHTLTNILFLCFHSTTFPQTSHHLQCTCICTYVVHPLILCSSTLASPPFLFISTFLHLLSSCILLFYISPSHYSPSTPTSHPLTHNCHSPSMYPLTYHPPTYIHVTFPPFTLSLITHPLFLRLFLWK